MPKKKVKDVKGGCIIDERKKKVLRRLMAIEGQVKGLQKMIEKDRYCVDILTQISSTHEALRGVAKIMMRNFLETCATNAIQSKNITKQEEIYNELMDVIYKFAK
ncbi:MAG: metal-sensitive transcriptional regulator [Candidatus Scalindua sediminis]